MDPTPYVLDAAQQLYARANDTTSSDSGADTESRPPVYKLIGISLAIGSGLFIGTSFVLKKVGLLKANEKYNEVAGEGYGYLKNVYWWSGMTLMIVGEICNFAAYAFTDAILVTSLGALSVVITTVLSAIFLKERLSMVGKVACFLCIVGSVVIVLNAPEESSVSDIQEMKHYVVAPGFLSYTGVVILGAVFLAFWAGPRYGKKNMFTYISICSWIGGLSVVSTQGLGSAIVAAIGGKPQFNHWFLYVVLVFVIGTLLTEIIFLNKALNLFNAAMVTPTYYVYFTSTTIITSAVLFQGFKGTAEQIVTVVMGFLTICSGVVLLQLSKSAKDVPDTAVFAGDLNQIHTIAEQEQPETEPKADAIRGAAAIVRRISKSRQKMEEEELRRLHEEKEAERLAPVSEDGQPEWQWDGLRRRRTTTLGSHMSRTFTLPSAVGTPVHPPLGRTRHLTDEELEEERSRLRSPGALSSIMGTIRGRAGSNVLPGHPSFSEGRESKAHSPLHTVQLTDINVSNQQNEGESSAWGYGLPPTLKTAYGGAASIASGHSDRHIQFAGTARPNASSASLAPPTPPPHGGELRSARRQFSFQNPFRRHHADRSQDQAMPSSEVPPSRQGIGSRGFSERQIRAKGATEEERAGLVTGDSHTLPPLPRYEQLEDDYDNLEDDDDLYQDGRRTNRYGRGLTGSSPRRESDSDDKEMEASDYEESRRRWNESRSRVATPPPPHPSEPRGTPRSGRGAFL
ncbi:magnesium transporter NIPA-domain-containing protein [Xylariomycetidae sp. FL0641]|nr:magnesium transporter NIPA-domain-containing protein [Xylariomycetidae sp. FL0641]